MSTENPTDTSDKNRDDARPSRGGALTSFEGLGLSRPILRVLKDVGYTTPSPIQASSIVPILRGRDLLGQAQTGTGKTAAFALPLIERIDLSLKTPQVLVLTPTRELAIQVTEAFAKYGSHLKRLQTLAVYGGQSIEGQLHRLRRGVQIVVGTPGRVMDHMRRGSLSLSTLQSLVLDEADEMLRMGFIDDVEWILEQTPQDRQVVLFSATMPGPIRKVARRHLRNPEEVHIRERTATVADTEQSYWLVEGTKKFVGLARILDASDFDAALVFVRTKNATGVVADKLQARGYSCAALNGDMTQALRERTIEQLKSRRLDIVVATDVAARGLDVSRITHVFNYDMPHDTEAYVHRIGRTGRAGRKGHAILFASHNERHQIRAIEKATRQRIEPLRLPTAASIAERRLDQFKARIVETVAKEKLEFFDGIVDEMRQKHGLSTGQVAAALAHMAQRDRPLQAPRERVRANRGDAPRPGAPVAGARDQRGTGKGRQEDAAPPSRRPRQRRLEEGMVRYRLEVGLEHDVAPSNIVGAIANEAGIDSEFIGAIQIFDDYSTVDLPEGMPREIFRELKRVKVKQRPLAISVFETTPSFGGNGPRGGFRPGGHGGKGKKPMRPKKHGHGAPRESRSDSRKPRGAAVTASDRGRAKPESRA